MNELFAIALSKIKGLGPKNAHLLLSKFSFEEIFSADFDPALLCNQGQIAKKQALIEAEKELKLCEEKGIQVIHCQSLSYPFRLLQCADAPVVLYVLGNLDLNRSKHLSVVGTRRATHYGKGVLESFFEDWEHSGLSIISGMAHGIDGQAHKLALKYGLPTLAVLGHGLKTRYPAAHRKLANEIVEQGGALLTEFTYNTLGLPEFFPMRNRIVAGLSDATLVVEASNKGGALITADLAHGYGREVFAVPGNIQQKYSLGCNRLIVNQKAQALISGKGLLQNMGWDKGMNAHAAQMQMALALNEDQEAVYALLNKPQGKHRDELLLELNWPVGKLMMVLLEMELQGYLRILPGNFCVKL